MKRGLVAGLFAMISVLSGSASAQSVNMAINLLDALSFTVTQPTVLAIDQDRSRRDNSIRAVASDHISVVSSRGYVVKAISGGSIGSGPGIQGLVHLTPLIGANNKGNTNGLVLESDVPLPPPNGSPVTVIKAANCSWNGYYSTNRFDIAYSIGNQYAYIDKNGPPSVIPVIFTVLQP